MHKPGDYVKYIDSDNCERSAVVWSRAHRAASYWVLPLGSKDAVLVASRRKSGLTRLRQIEDTDQRNAG